jgi:hypothetical protein
MFKWGTSILSTTTLFFAAFSSSPSYQLKSYGIGAGGSNNSSSTTYTLQGSLGEQAGNSTTGTTYSANISSIQAEQINVPGAPTLSNGSGTFYNQLMCVIDTSNNPSDTAYDIAVLPSPYSTTYYVQADGTLGATPVWQTNSVWGSSGFQIIGLTPSTGYEAKVSAKEGLFTNTEYGPLSGIVSTVAPTISFSVSPNSYSFGSFLPNVITTSSTMSFNFATNGTSGGSVYVNGANNGFKSVAESYTIPAVSGDLSSLSSGIGIQATNPNQTSGGPLTTVSPYNGTSNVVGAEGSTFAQMLTSGAAIGGGTANANVQVKASGTTPTATDYSEVFSFVASAGF